MFLLNQIKAFGLNRLDIWQREGEYPPPPGASEILGVEFSGDIEEVGEGVDEWKVGDAVMGLAGGVSQPIVLRRSALVLLFTHYYLGCICRIYRYRT